MAAASPKNKGVFVTGTNTGVGKTIIAASLALFLRSRGLDIGVMKPVESGVTNPAHLGPDASLLQWAANCHDADSLISPYRLTSPIAPSDAAKIENIFIDFSELTANAQFLVKQHDFTIIEGAGGLMTPLTGGLLVADLVRAIGLPLLVVSTAQLGTINHTLLTIFSAQQMGIPVAGFVVNRMPEHPDLAAQSAPHSLASLASADILGIFPETSGNDQDKVRFLSNKIESLPSLPWLLAALEA